MDFEERWTEQMFDYHNQTEEQELERRREAMRFESYIDSLEDDYLLEECGNE